MSNKSMRSPRRMDTTHKSLEKVTWCQVPPSLDSISQKLWSNSLAIAKEALASNYIQGIAAGNLDPNDYAHYKIQDFAYCHHAQQDYQTLAARSHAEGYSELAAFARSRCENYVKYIAQLREQWHLLSSHAVLPGKAAQAYIDFEKYVAHTLPPIYGVLVMIPCDQLWAWLATELEKDRKPSNVYDFWILENNDWHGAYRLGNFLNTWFANHPEAFDPTWARYVFQSSMTGEVNFFRSATNQPLIPMPEKPAEALSSKR